MDEPERCGVEPGHLYRIQHLWGDINAVVGQALINPKGRRIV